MSGLAFLVNGGPESAMAERARAFAARLGPGIVASIHHRPAGRAAAIARHLRALRRRRPATVYVLDLAAAGVAAALLYRRVAGAAVVIDTGDAVADLLRSTGRVGPLGQRLVGAWEARVLRTADAVVVRGTGHRQLLESRGIRVADVIPDGVDTRRFQPAPADEVRARLGLEGRLVVGVLGSLRWNARLGWSPGLELIEALAGLPSERIVGLVVGGGSGGRPLRRAAERRGVSGRVRWVEDWVTHDALPPLVNAMDVALSTQTDDVVGRVRTTGKLPLFLACGRFVLASRVGEAARVLPDEMLVDYHGGFDPAYPTRLAERIHALRDDDVAGARKVSRVIAERFFDYDVLAPRLAAVLHRVSEGR